MALTEATAGRTINDAAMPVRVTLAEACKKGDLLGYSSGWKRALATVGTAIQAKLIAGEDGASGDVITAYSTALVSGFTGGTPGGALYAAEGTSYGCYTESAPVTTGDCNTIIGLIVSATEVLAWPGNRVESLA
jgi:hypothetical protein